jgi:hypothetical protein
VSKKDYIAIAAAIKATLPVVLFAQNDATVAVIRAIADAMARDNPAFNRSRFMTACGL